MMDTQQQRALCQFMLERHEPLAVVGVGMRFPGGNDTLAAFDTFLREGRSGIGPLPRDRWTRDPVRADGRADLGMIRTGAGGFLDRIDEFDAGFFNVAPKQVPYIDPQQRLLLESAWEALEDANLDPAGLRHGNGGIYVGGSPLDFALELGAVPDEQLDGSLGTGAGAYSMSGRLSYFLGWRGPSLTTDTACASSLTALHLAAQGLRRRECDIALCAAVNALHSPRSMLILSHAQMLAPDGHCKTFDEAADGYARAEGCGVLVLKRLSDALMDQDTVLALIRGTAIGQDGESAGLTAPNGTAQELVMRAALENARLEPGDIQYVEAHGTGTPLGDPIELSSVNAVFGAAHRDGEPLRIGSLKSNLGHMEPAAGMGGLIKVIAQFRAGVYYPHLYRKPSSQVPWDSYPLSVPTETAPWEAPVRRAVVNSFGVAGAIGVAVLEEAPRPEATDRWQEGSGDGSEPGAEPGGQVFTLSAKSRTALGLQIRRQLDFLAAHPDTALADLCYTRAVGRSHFRHRFALAAEDTAGLVTALERRAAEPPAADGDTFRKVAYLFTGSGSQYPGMGRELYPRYPVFRAGVDACDALFRPHLGRSVRQVMFGQDPDSAETLARTSFTHAALFTLEYALARQWEAWGVRPSVLIGHSLGEIAAAAFAGLFSLEDGVTFCATRALLIESVSAPGGMAAVAAPAAELAPLLAAWPDLAVAAVNSPKQSVISGGSGSLAAAVERLRGSGLRVTPLPVASAFHSPLMAEVSDRLREAAARIDFKEPLVSIVSNLTGRVASARELSTPEYWVRHLNEPVDFAAGIQAIGGRGRHVFLEVGPAASLLRLAGRNLPAGQHRWLASLDPDKPQDTVLRQSLAGLYDAGLRIDWAAVYAGRRARRITLPGYAFDRRRYWLPDLPVTRPTSGGDEGGGLLGREDAAAGAPDDGVRRFSSRISAATPGYLADHTLGGRVFVPATAYLELLLELQDALYGETTRPVEEVRFHEALFLGDRQTTLSTRARPAPDGRTAVEISTRTGDGPGGERVHVTAFLGAATAQAPSTERSALLERLRTATGGEHAVPDQVLEPEQVYDAYARAGLAYGPQFRRVRSLARYGADFTVSELDATGLPLGERLPPPLLDGATHGLAALADDGHRYLSTGIARLLVHRKPRAGRLRALLKLTNSQDDSSATAFTLDVLLLEGEAVVAEVSGMAFTRLAQAPARPRPAAAEAAAEARPAGERRPEDAFVALIRSSLGELLSIEDVTEIDRHASFLELGVDSLTAIGLTDQLASRMGVRVAVATVFDHDSVEALAGFLHREATTTPATTAR